MKKSINYLRLAAKTMLLNACIIAGGLFASCGFDGGKTIPEKPETGIENDVTGSEDDEFSEYEDEDEENNIFDSENSADEADSDKNNADGEDDKTEISDDENENQSSPDEGDSQENSSDDEDNVPEQSENEEETDDSDQHQLITPTENEKYSAGDIIYSDGTSSKPDEYDSEKKAVAVVFFDADGNALGLGIEKIKQVQWSPKDTAGYNTKFEAIQSNYNHEKQTISGDVDGSDNWEEILKKEPDGAADDETNYPAFYFVNSYAEKFELTGTDFETGWYVPSIFELSAIYNNIEVLNETLQIITKADNYLNTKSEQGYWSASQTASDDTKAWFINFQNGDIKVTVKSTKRYVRAIRKLP